ncbi:hypothetical protein D3C87_1522020 [compost metagenome]
MFDNQLLGVFDTQADQRPGRTLARAAALEANRLDVEQAHGLFMVEAMQDGLVVEPQQFFSLEGACQCGQVLPVLLALFLIFKTVGGQLLQQQATSDAAIGLEPEARPQLLGQCEIVGEAFGQVHAVEFDNALVAFALGRVDGHGQLAVGHQLMQAGAGHDPVGLVTRKPTDLALAGAFDHQQRHASLRIFRARLQDQQAIEFQRAHQQ